MNFKLLYNKFYINKLLIIIFITVLTVFIYNKYISPENQENFEENTTTPTTTKTEDVKKETAVVQVPSKPVSNSSPPVLAINNDELMSRLELVTQKLETLINVFSKKNESFTTVETTAETTVETNENEDEETNEDENEETNETQLNNKKNIVKETFVSNPVNTVHGYDSYLYDGYYMKL